MHGFISEKFTELLNEIYDSVEDKPGRVVYVAPGAQIAWDDCCDGQLTARLASLTPVVQAGANIQNCGVSYWNASVEITMLRCALTLDDNGVAPRPDMLTYEGIDAISDSDVIISELLKADWIKRIIGWAPLGPTAGCRGIAVTASFDLDSPHG